MTAPNPNAPFRPHAWCNDPRPPARIGSPLVVDVPPAVRERPWLGVAAWLGFVMLVGLVVMP
jgi:hypothetical protein